MKAEESNDTVKEMEEKDRKSLFGLMEMRQSKGISFQQIVEATRVSPSMIEALEGNDFEKLPEPVYTKAFLRSYANALSIDSGPLIERYNLHFSTQEKPDDIYSHLKKRRPAPSALPRILTFLLLLAFFSLAAYYFWEYYGSLNPVKQLTMKIAFDGPATQEGRQVIEEPAASDEGPATPRVQTIAAESEKIDTTETVAPSQETPVAPVTIAAVPTDVQPEALTKPEAPSTELVLEIRASELTWVQIARDGAPPEQLYLRAGSIITRKADARFEIIVGNAGGAEVIFQGTSLGTIGNQGEVVFLRLPEEG